MQTQHITNAVRACLTECYSSADPLATIAAFTTRLHADPAWSNQDVWVVETNVLRLLSLIVRQPDDLASTEDSTAGEITAEEPHALRPPEVHR
jgi:hypothetical protein